MSRIESIPLLPDEDALSQAFLRDGCVVVEAEDGAVLQRIRNAVAALAAQHLGVEAPDEPQAFLDQIHNLVDVPALNALRLAVINGINELDWPRQAYFSLVRHTLEILVGNELAVQRRLNLSIQLPDDDSSLLHVHADVWDGDSPFEVVVWLPLVDCAATKGMYLLPPDANAHHAAKMGNMEGQSAEDLYRMIEDDLVLPDLPFGKVLVFGQNLMHGNRINATPESRWSMNCRFKGLFTPYADKRLGEFFEPLNIKAASRMGMEYKLPGGFGSGEGA